LPARADFSVPLMFRIFNGRPKCSTASFALPTFDAAGLGSCQAGAGRRSSLAGLSRLPADKYVELTSRSTSRVHLIGDMIQTLIFSDGGGNLLGGWGFLGKLLHGAPNESIGGTSQARRRVRADAQTSAQQGKYGGLE
jgi:hypothetical protein